MLVKGDIRLAYGGARGAPTGIASSIETFLSLDGPDLAYGCDIVTLLLLSWFTDRRAGEGEFLPGDLWGPGLAEPIRRDNDPRGWWFDLPAFSRSPMGSRLWLLQREIQSEETRQRAERYGQEALDWIVEDGIASKITCEASFPRRGALWLRGYVTRGLVSDPYRVEWPWGNTAVACAAPTERGRDLISIDFSSSRFTFDGTALRFDRGR